MTDEKGVENKDKTIGVWKSIAFLAIGGLILKKTWGWIKGAFEKLPNFVKDLIKLPILSLGAIFVYTGGKALWGKIFGKKNITGQTPPIQSSESVEKKEPPKFVVPLSEPKYDVPGTVLHPIKEAALTQDPTFINLKTSFLATENKPTQYAIIQTAQLNFAAAKAEELWITSAQTWQGVFRTYGYTDENQQKQLITKLLLAEEQSLKTNKNVPEFIKDQILTKYRPEIDNKTAGVLRYAERHKLVGTSETEYRDPQFTFIQPQNVNDNLGRFWPLWQDYKSKENSVKEKAKRETPLTQNEQTGGQSTADKAFVASNTTSVKTTSTSQQNTGSIA